MENTRHIYHIIPKRVWNKAQKEKTYAPETLAEEGFIHCSYDNDLGESANRYFEGQDALYILEIDPKKVSAEVKYEESHTRHAIFPHIYGELNLDAVVRIHRLEADKEGKFSF